MSLNLNQFNSGPLAAIASDRVGNLNLPLYGVDVGAPQEGTYQGALAAAQLKEQYAGLQTELARQQLANQGQLAIGQQRNQFEGQQNAAQRAIQQQLANQQGKYQQGMLLNDAQKTQLLGQQTSQQGQYQQGMLANDAARTQLMDKQLDQDTAYKTGMLGVEQQKANQDKLVQELQARMMLNTQQLNMRGAGGSALLMAMNSAGSDPKAQLQAAQQLIPLLQQKGIIDADEAAQMMKSGDPNQIKQLATVDLFMSGMAKDGKDSGIAGMMPGANLLFGNAPLGKKGTEENTDLLSQSQRSKLDLTSTLVNMDPRMFSNGGNLESWYGNIISKAPDIVQKYAPGAKNAKDFASAMSGFKSNTFQGMLDTLAQQKGVRFNKLTLDALAPEVPDPSTDGPDVGFSKIVTLIQRMDRASNFAQDLLKQGIKMGSKEFDDKTYNFVINDHAAGAMHYKNAQGQETDLRYSDIKNFMDKNNMSYGDSMKYLLSHGASI